MGVDLVGGLRKKGGAEGVGARLFFSHYRIPLSHTNTW